MNLETKVGFFVLIGMMVAAVSVMKLSDVRLQKSYTLYFLFDDIQGLRDQSQVKVAGVEVGKVNEITLENGRAKIKARINDGVAVYANGRVRVNLVGLIGSQYLELIPGTPSAPLLKDGESLEGERTKSLNDLIEKLNDLVEGKPGRPGVGQNLQATMQNLREVSDALNYAIGHQRDELRAMVNNLSQFTYDLKGMAKDMHELTSSKKGDIDAAITKLRSILERVDGILATVQKGEGAVGKLVADKEMGDEVKKTVSNLKDTSASAKEVLARFVKVRSFWEFQLRAGPAGVRGDGGIRLQPRDHKYYYLGVENAGDRKDEYRDEGDYEDKATITAVLGKEFGPVTVELGAIRSSAGIGLKYYPFRSRVEPSTDTVRVSNWRNNFMLESRAFDFGRDESRGRAGRERRFKSPHFNVGARYKVSRSLALGASVEDLAEVRQYSLNTHVAFEDRDLAYLFGFISFAR